MDHDEATKLVWGYHRATKEAERSVTLEHCSVQQTFYSTQGDERVNVAYLCTDS